MPKTGTETSVSKCIHCGRRIVHLDWCPVNTPEYCLAHDIVLEQGKCASCDDDDGWTIDHLNGHHGDSTVLDCELCGEELAPR